jgi:hypothetical protein
MRPPARRRSRIIPNQFASFRLSAIGFVEVIVAQTSRSLLQALQGHHCRSFCLSPGTCRELCRITNPKWRNTYRDDHSQGYAAGRPSLAGFCVILGWVFHGKLPPGGYWLCAPHTAAHARENQPSFVRFSRGSGSPCRSTSRSSGFCRLMDCSISRSYPRSFGS